MPIYIYTFVILLDNKVVKEIPNVFASSMHSAVESGWMANAAKPYRDGKHVGVAYR